MKCKWRQPQARSPVDSRRWRLRRPQFRSRQNGQLDEGSWSWLSGRIGLSGRGHTGFAGEPGEGEPTGTVVIENAIIHVVDHSMLAAEQSGVVQSLAVEEGDLLHPGDA